MGTTYEDVFFYLDLTKNMLKKKDIIKFLKLYIQEKNKINIKGHYGILIFQDEGNPIFMKDKKDSEIIIKAIEENWQYRLKKSLLESGLFYICSYIAETIRKKSKFNRIIIITDTPSDLAEDYQEALFELVSKIKIFPTFIDIIRVAETGQRFFKDDVKLNILASDTKGGMFYIQDKKELQEISGKLVKNKQLVSTFTDKPDQLKISRDDYLFYNNLAKSLKAPQSWENLKCSFCQDRVCPVCTDIYDVPHLCEECGAAFHNCCVLNYVITHNIGIPHIFRCPSCDILLKIKEDEIVEISSEVMDESEVISVRDYLEKDEFDDSHKGQEIIKLDDSTPVPKDSQKEESKKAKKKEVYIGGYFGAVFTVKKVGDKLVYERTSKKTLTQAEKNYKNLQSINYWNPSNNQNSKKSKIKICPLCGNSISFDAKKCAQCGHDF
ncbi:MAG: hypothetical protein ACFFDK_02340 [Promethearchaeota archaeon]